MSRLSVKQVTKRFGGVVALDNCSLNILDGEIIALLGPSGCGKTTLLNLIAGFETPDSGEIWLHDRIVNHVPPNKRDAGMVFQQYALFPHMTVRQNIAYGLEARKFPKAKIEEAVLANLSLLKLDQLANRYPSELSGGQKQRVAVARALAIRPRVLLMDEAFSALDKNLREEMQIELSLLFRQIGATAIFVTHDQKEAFAIADRIVLMGAGRVVQVGTPRSLYQEPNSSFVLEFLGTVNRLNADVRGIPGGAGALVTEVGIVLPLPRSFKGDEKGEHRVYIRAEDIVLSRSPTAVHNDAPGKVSLVTFLGASCRHIISLGDKQIIADQTGVRDGLELSPGDEIYIDVKTENCHVVPRVT